MKISIIIPTLNRLKQLKTILKQLEKQCNENCEIIVIDNGSTYDIERELKDFPIRILKEVEKSSYAARNRGIDAAKGEILIFLDDDEEFTHNFIKNAIGDMKNADLGFANLIYTNINSRNNFLDYFEREKSGNWEKYIKNGWAGAGALFIKRYVFDKIGKFNDNLISGGDKEFTKRATDNGFKLKFLKKAVCYHPTRHTFKKNIEKAMRLGIGFRKLYNLNTIHFFYFYTKYLIGNYIMVYRVFKKYKLSLFDYIFAFFYPFILNIFTIYGHLFLKYSE